LPRTTLHTVQHDKVAGAPLACHEQFSPRYFCRYSSSSDHPADAVGRTDERDVELILVGRQAKASRYASIIAGDLNDVGWSQTTQVFQKVSGLLDPRKGRGLYATFHADYPFLRYPLDHLFHAAEFRLRHMEVLEHFGSDHFPLLMELMYEPERQGEQDVPQMDEQDHEQADEKVEQVHKERL
jgi:hypothetical protein